MYLEINHKMTIGSLNKYREYGRQNSFCCPLLSFKYWEVDTDLGVMHSTQIIVKLFKKASRKLTVQVCKHIQALVEMLLEPLKRHKDITKHNIN